MPGQEGSEEEKIEAKHWVLIIVLAVFASSMLGFNLGWQHLYDQVKYRATYDYAACVTLLGQDRKNDCHEAFLKMWEN